MTNIRLNMLFLALNARVQDVLEGKDPAVIREIAVLLMEKQLPNFHEFAHHLMEVEASSNSDMCENAADMFGQRMMQVAWENSVFDGAAYYEDMRTDEERDESW